MFRVYTVCRPTLVYVHSGLALGMAVRGHKGFTTGGSTAINSTSSSRQGARCI